MPYRKKAYKKRNGRPGYMSCGKMVWGDAKKALVLAQGLKRLVNVEIKNHDVVATTAAMSVNLNIVQLTNIQQGDTTITRDGAQCKMLHLEMAYSILVDPTLPRTLVRIMVVVDKQTNQGIYTALDLLEDSSSQDNIVAPRNLDNKHRFSILYDRVHVLSLALISKVYKR